MAKKIVDKKSKKHFVGKCTFCGESNYSLLDLHRIVEGEQGGIYSDFNTLVVCANDHRKIHAKEIVIDRKYFSTSGRWVLHYWQDGQENWKEVD